MEKGKQMRFTDAELSLLRGVFGGNDKLVKLLRKIFLPQYDPEAPFMDNIDLWMTIDVRSLSPEAAFVRLLARNETINHIEARLAEVHTLANTKEETPDEVVQKKIKNSSK